MDEDNVTSTEGQEATQITEGASNNSVNLPTTVEELNAMLQKEGDKRVTSALKKKEAELTAKIEQEKEEAAKLARMSAQEREKAKFEKERETFIEERATFQKEQLKMQTEKELITEGLPHEFVNFVIADNAETIKENIANLKALFTRAVEESVLKKVSTPSPKAGATNINNNDFMSAINKNRLR